MLPRGSRRAAIKLIFLKVSSRLWAPPPAQPPRGDKAYILLLLVVVVLIRGPTEHSRHGPPLQKEGTEPRGAVQRVQSEQQAGGNETDRREV